MQYIYIFLSYYNKKKKNQNQEGGKYFIGSQFLS